LVGAPLSDLAEEIGRDLADLVASLRVIAFPRVVLTTAWRRPKRSHSRSLRSSSSDPGLTTVMLTIPLTQANSSRRATLNGGIPSSRAICTFERFSK
jgi:hypothetical protein